MQSTAKLTTDPVAFGCDFFTCLLRQPHYEANEFKGCKKPNIILVINDDVVTGR